MILNDESESDKNESDNEDLLLKNVTEQLPKMTPKKQLRNTRGPKKYNNSETSIQSILMSNNDEAKKIELLKKKNKSELYEYIKYNNLFTKELKGKKLEKIVKDSLLKCITDSM